MDISTDETVSDVRKAAAALGPQIREAADEIEQGRRLPPRIAQAMKECGILLVRPTTPAASPPYDTGSTVAPDVSPYAG